VFKLSGAVAPPCWAGNRRARIWESNETRSEKKEMVAELFSLKTLRERRVCGLCFFCAGFSIYTSIFFYVNT